ncbi:MAG: hypothetical protein GAKPKEKM_03157 [Rhodocyclaceae bacterium]|nr:hypothetical protein [Rhodocyclaceae bacterium]
MGGGHHRQAEEQADAGQRNQREGEGAPVDLRHARGNSQSRQHGAAEQERHAADVGEDQGAVEPAEGVVGLRIVREQPPRRVVFQRPERLAGDQPFGGGLLEGDEPRADGPLEGADGQAQHAEDEQQRFALARRLAGEHLGVGGARGQFDGVAVAAAIATVVAVGGAGHVLDVEQRRAIDGAGARRIAVPGLAVDAEVHRRHACEQGEDAGDRTEIAAPDALAAAVEPADGDGGERRAAEDQQRRLRVFVDADQLPVEGGQHEGREGPAAPAQPARDGEALAVARGEFGERPLRAEHAAPDAAHEHDGEDDEGPPDAPEQVLGGEHHALVPEGRVGRHLRLAGRGAEEPGEQPRLGMRQRQEGRQRDEDAVEQHDEPLQAEDGAAVAHHPVAQARQAAAPRMAHEHQRADEAGVSHGGPPARRRGPSAPCATARSPRKRRWR